MAPPRNPKRKGIKYTIRDVDRGYRKIRERAKALAAAKPHVKVGVFDDGKPREPDPENPNNRYTNTQIAAVHEYGAPRAGIPARAPLRTTFDANRAKYRRLCNRLGGAYMAGTMPLRRALGILGQTYVADVRATVRAGLSPPLAAATLLRKMQKGKWKKPRKGRKRLAPKPLIDTGQLLASYTYRVELGKG